jgi:hypothetical protein
MTDLPEEVRGTILRLRVSFALLTIASGLCAPSRADPGRPFESELARLAGRGARQCALVSLRGDPKPGWQCVLQAERDRAPFWYALQQRGYDSEVWLAAIRTPSGEHIVMTYDSNVYGGRGFHPSFQRQSCPGGIDYRPADDIPLHCKTP